MSGRKLQKSAWQRLLLRVTPSRSLKASRECGTSSQLNVREPGENPGRLRHCMEIQTPIAMRLHCGPSHWSKDREGRSEVRLQVRIPVELRSSGEGRLKVEG